MTHYHLGKNIKQLVERKGVKASELSEKLSLSQQQVYRIYKQDHLNTELLEKISEALDEPISIFFQDPEEVKSSTSVGEHKPKYQTALDKCHQELEQWRSKAFDYIEKYNQLLEQQVQQQNRQNWIITSKENRL